MWGESEDLGFLGGALDMVGILCAIGFALALVLILAPLLVTPIGLLITGLVGAVLVLRRAVRRR